MPRVSEQQRGTAGLEMARVAEVMVSRPGGASRRGSGYRVGVRHVLTAAHVVEPPLTTLRVRFEADRPGEWTGDAQVVLRSGRADLALLEMTGLPAAAPPVHHTPRYAVLPESDTTLSVTAVGFPRFKLREDPGPVAQGALVRYRDSCHIEGTVSVLSNLREGTLEVAVRPPADEVAPEHSPWEGMSGAALWAGGAIIGLISAHHRSDGLGRLAAVRVQRWYDGLVPAELELLRSCAGLPAQPVPVGSPGSADGPAVPSPRAPSLASLPHTLSMRELKDLVDALTAVPALRRPNGLDTVLEGVDPRVAAHRPRDDRLRYEVYGVLRTCLRYPGTLDRFMEVLRDWEEDSEELRTVDRVAAELAVRHS
ncbi:trypsin-like peptidase domain-containing protein [Streptomyces sp. NPDC020800]|uniref:effector-associated domain 2-containing protein n=1 Tax=Streptomyces sp. NPDC020800 TaxID=3365092 RepID=UPI0037ACE2D8